MKIRTIAYRVLNFDHINNVYFSEDGYLLADSNDCKSCNKRIRTINSFSDKLNEVNINLMIIPNAIGIYSDKLPKNAVYYNQIVRVIILVIKNWMNMK